MSFLPGGRGIRLQILVSWRVINSCVTAVCQGGIITISSYNDDSHTWETFIIRDWLLGKRSFGDIWLWREKKALRDRWVGTTLSGEVEAWKENGYNHLDDWVV